MKTVVVVVSFALALGSACPGQAGYYTGNEMLKMCLDRKDDLEFGTCTGFVAALGGIIGCEEGGYVGSSGASVPSGVTLGQLKKVAIKWMEAHPEQLHHDAADLMGKAFQDAFPCS